MDPDLGDAYRSARERVTAVVRSAMAADGAAPERAVPATPGWRIHDLVAHLAGVVEDVRNGNTAGVATDPWTAAQVERGRTKSTSQLLEEWTAGAPPIEGFLSSPDGGAAWQAVLDVHTHEADLAHALGRRSEAPSEMWSWMSEQMLSRFAADAAANRLEPVTVVATPFEIVRGRLGRRTADEVRSYDWSVDPEPYLDLFFVFGRREVSLGERPPVA
jgi:uncharacterized protein (TIGR03083 family)